MSKWRLIVVLGVALLSACHRHRTAHAHVPPPPQAAEAPPSNAPAPPGTVQPAPSNMPESNETGLASWYGHPYHGRPSASGEIYDMEKLTAAHRTLPFGTWVRVHDLDNSKSVDVRINDRGPFVDGRIIDISHAAAREIEMIGPGIAKVRLEILSEPAAQKPARYAVQVGAFRNRDNAERLCGEMQSRYGAARLVLRSGNPALWRVLVGRESTEDGAGTLAERIRAERHTSAEEFVVRLDSI